MQSGGLVLHQDDAASSASVFRFLPKNHAMKIDTTYKAIIGVANNIMFGMSPVGLTTAATIRIMISETFQLLIKNCAETMPIRERTYVMAGIWKINPIASMMMMMKSR